MSFFEFVGSGLQSLGLIRNGAKELPLKGRSFSQYKGDLFRQRAACEKKLWDAWKYKTEVNREEVIKEIEKINNLLKPVYDYEFSRKVFPL